jgi:glycosyltransferase involved in cell wall biosynthesis
MKPMSTGPHGVQLVSVVTPSLNQARFLEATLQSVAEQDYPNIEHLILDGGSSDETVNILTRWGEMPHILWTSGPDGGQADAIQRGIDAARGNVVGWLNSDDIYLDSHVIADVMSLFAKGADVVTGGGWYISETGTRLEPIPVRADALRFRTLRHVDWVLQPATFVRKAILTESRLDTSLHYAFDWDLFIQLSRKYKFTVLPKALAGYRLHAAAKTVGRGEKRRQEIRTVAARYNPWYSPQYLSLSLGLWLESGVERLPPAARQPLEGLLRTATRVVRPSPRPRI